jgi:hypothetical protein
MINASQRDKDECFPDGSFWKGRTEGLENMQFMLQPI